MQLAVVGVGVTGGSLACLLEKLGHQVARYDPTRGFSDDIAGAKIVFVCVPTKDTRLEDLEKAVLYVAKKNREGLVVIRSTLVPGAIERLEKQYGREFVYLPEFLRERAALEDELYPQYIIVGTESRATFAIFRRLFRPILSEDRIMMFTPLEAELAKIAANSFYLAKVMFGNELYDICERYGAKYSPIFKLFELDRYVNPMHLQPLLDGYRGAGGKCLPKDTAFLISAAKNKGVIPRMIEAAWEENERLLATK